MSNTKSIGEWALKYEESPVHLKDVVLNDAQMDLSPKQFGDLLWLLIRRLTRNRSTLIDKKQENENDLKHLQETDFHYRKITQKPD